MWELCLVGIDHQGEVLFFSGMENLEFCGLCAISSQSAYGQIPMISEECKTDQYRLSSPRGRYFKLYLVAIGQWEVLFDYHKLKKWKISISGYYSYDARPSTPLISEGYRTDQYHLSSRRGRMWELCLVGIGHQDVVL